MTQNKFLLLCILFLTPFSLLAQTFTHKAGPHGLMENGMQAVHTQTKVVYGKAGDVFNVYRPDYRSYRAYIRWYDYDKDSAAVNIALIDTAAFDDTNSAGWFKFSGNTISAHQFRIKYTMQDSVYRLACDQSAYTDYVRNSEGLIEPTLSKRQIYEFRPAAEIAARVDTCTGDKYLEEYHLIAPTIRQLFIGPQYPIANVGVSAMSLYYNTYGFYYYRQSNPITMREQKIPSTQDGHYERPSRHPGTLGVAPECDHRCRRTLAQYTDDEESGRERNTLYPSGWKTI